MSEQVENKWAMSSMEALRSGVRAAGASVLPLSASPTRTDPRPPTCATIGVDLARSLRRVAGEDVELEVSLAERDKQVARGRRLENVVSGRDVDVAAWAPTDELGEP